MKKQTVFGNMGYMLKNWFAWEKKSFLYMALRVPAVIVVPMITAYIPKVMIDCIENHVSVGALVLRVALISCVIAGASWISPYMQQKLTGAGQIIRMRYAVLSFQKTMTVDFSEIESLAGRKRLERSKQFTDFQYSGAQDFCDVCCQFFVGLVGIVSSAALLNRLPILLLGILILTCMCEFFIFQVEYKADRRHRRQRNALFVRFDYFYRESRDFAAGKDIRLYSLGDWFIKLNADLLRTYTKLMGRFIGISFGVSALQAALSAVRDGVSYFFLIRAVQNGTISVSDFIFYFGIVTGFSGYVSLLNFEYNQLIRCSLECTKFREYTETKENARADKPAVPRADGYSVEFRNVRFRYPDSDGDTLCGMSFCAKKGENIAIVGENGAGKTTAIKLLCGLYDPTAGEILVNGKPAAEFSKDSYFDLFSVVFQDYRFLPVSVAENTALCPKEEIDGEKLAAVLKMAGIDEKIASLPQKENAHMDKTIYKEAVDFSGGEKQKLLLARALYKDAPILILDEPTAALDPIAENEMYLKYNAFSEGKTSFFISHRLSSTRFCDRILFISEGKIAEAGTHEALMALRGGYYRMYQMQSYYYREEAGCAVCE